MNEEKSIFDIITDSEDNGNVVLCDESGVETEFEQEATLDIDDKIYCILCPLDEEGNVSEEGYVFKLDPENHDLLELVADDETIDKAFELYEQLCNEE